MDTGSFRSGLAAKPDTSALRAGLGGKLDTNGTAKKSLNSDSLGGYAPAHFQTAGVKVDSAAMSDSAKTVRNFGSKLDTNGVAANAKLLQGRDSTDYDNAKTLQGKDTIAMHTYAGRDSAKVQKGDTGLFNRVVVPLSSVNSQGQFGTYELQSYAVNNAWLTENIYYGTSAFKYRANGFGIIQYMLNGGFAVRTVPSGTAGNTATLTEKFTILNNGKTAIGDNLTPKNKLDVAGAMVIGASSAGVDTAPTNGLLVNGATALCSTATRSTEKLFVKGNILSSDTIRGTYLGSTGNIRSANGADSVSITSGNVFADSGLYAGGQTRATSKFAVDKDSTVLKNKLIVHGQAAFDSTATVGSYSVGDTAIIRTGAAAAAFAASKRFTTYCDSSQAVDTINLAALNASGARARVLCLRDSVFVTNGATVIDTLPAAGKWADYEYLGAPCLRWQIFGSN